MVQDLSFVVTHFEFSLGKSSVCTVVQIVNLWKMRNNKIHVCIYKDTEIILDLHFIAFV